MFVILFRRVWGAGRSVCSSSTVVQHPEVKALPPEAAACWKEQVPSTPKGNPKPRTGKRQRNLEHSVRDRLASRLSGARTEVRCSSGIVDILTDDEVIEVKRASMWKAALGQVLAYSEDFPGRRRRIHLFDSDIQNFALATKVCENLDVRVTNESGR